MYVRRVPSAKNRPGLAHLRERQATFPALLERLDERTVFRSAQRGVPAQNLPRHLLGTGKDRAIADQVGNGELRHPALACAEKLARTAKLEVLFSDDEAVV